MNKYKWYRTRDREDKLFVKTSVWKGKKGATHGEYRKFWIQNIKGNQL